MQPNVIVAEAIGHRARLAWLGAALAATVAIVVATSVLRDAPRTLAPAAARVEQPGWSHRMHRCGNYRMNHARAEERARREAERARREAERARREAHVFVDYE